MTTIFLITSLALVPYFATRAFVPLFATAAVARYGGEAEFLARLTGVEVLDGLPSALTSDLALWVLFALALVELVATKIPEARELLQVGDPPLKAAAATALVGAMAYGSIEGSSLVAGATPPAGVAWLSVTGPLAHAWALVVGAAVWLTALLRNAIWGFLIEIDEHDDLRLQALLSWLEDALGFFGVLFVVILPSAALALTGLTILGLWVTRRVLIAREASRRIPCPQCGTPCPACGLRCASCGAVRVEVREVGWLGTIREGLATDRLLHRLHLLAQKRCGACGERLVGRRADNACDVCDQPTFRDLGDLERYLSMVRARLPKVLGVLFLLGFVPLLGLVVGIVYYRLSIVASLRSYVPRSTGFLARWITRLGQIVLIVLQPIPLLGALTLPLLCLMSYGVYSGLLRRHARAVLAPAAAPVPYPAHA